MRWPFVRFIPGWKKFALIGAPTALALALVAGAVAYSTSASATQPTSPALPNPAVDVPAQTGLLVHVVGAVENPGLYRLPRGDRVFDAIAAAGGFSPDADMSRLPNLAGRLKDGEQIKVPFAKTTSGTVTTRININTATLEDLESVPGFTIGFAQDCIDYRVNFGGFQNLRELVDILGMSEAEYVIARKFLTL